MEKAKQSIKDCAVTAIHLMKIVYCFSARLPDFVLVVLITKQY